MKLDSQAHEFLYPG